MWYCRIRNILERTERIDRVERMGRVEKMEIMEMIEMMEMIGKEGRRSCETPTRTTTNEPPTVPKASVSLSRVLSRLGTWMHG